MRKFLTITSLIVTSVYIVFLFVTATTYQQLGIAALSYPLLAYLCFKSFPKSTKTSTPSIAKSDVVVSTPPSDDDATDVDKRSFLKLIGAAGVSFFLFSLFKGQGSPVLFGGQQKAGASTLEDSQGQKIDPAERKPTDGYSISEIEDDMISYYGFTNKDGAWFIMRVDNETSSLRYLKGDTDFPSNWTKRKEFSYDYFHNVF
jgi:hypothetical protein